MASHAPCSSGGSDCSPSPVAVSGLTDALEVSVSSRRTCARRSSGAVVCWGSNIDGGLGDGTTTDRYVPVAVTGLTDAIEISGDNGHTCVVRASGGVACWGWNGDGQLGDGTTVDRSAPGAVSDLAVAVEVSLGAWHTCARRASGAALCWGSNEQGQLGDGLISHSMCFSGDCSLTPVVSGVTDALGVSVGGYHTCVRRASGAVVCWGLNEHGELGDGTTSHSSCAFGLAPVDCSYTPVVVSGLADAVDLSAGWGHACARRASGAVVCWGLNVYGQLGDGTMSHSICSFGDASVDCSLTPVEVVAP